MHTTTAALPTFDDLARFVKATLCERDCLDPDATPFVQTPIRRRDELWGYAFHVAGPRDLKTSAVWSVTDAAILIYNSVGTRVQRVAITEGPACDDGRSASRTLAATD